MATGSDKLLRDSKFIRGLKDEQMKVYIEFIAVDDRRPKFIYEALADTKNGQACLKTVIVYDGTSNQVLYSIERQDVWNDQWDTDAEAKAQADGYSIGDTQP
jgi:hypothetical protein